MRQGPHFSAAIVFFSRNIPQLVELYFDLDLISDSSASRDFPVTAPTQTDGIG